MAITNLQVVTGYYDSLGTPSIESAVTVQLAAGWIPQGAPVLTDVYGQVAQSMVKSTNLSTTAYTVATGATPMAPDATWNTLGNPTWIESGRYLQAYSKGDQVGAKVDLVNQVTGVLPVANGGTGVSTQAAMWGAIKPAGATPLSADPVAPLDAVTKQWAESEISSSTSDAVDSMKTELASVKGSSLIYGFGAWVTDERFAGGAKCDGVTNDLAAFQACATHASANNIPVVLPPGVTMKLSGAGNVVLTAGANFNGATLDVSEYAGQIRLQRKVAGVTYSVGSSLITNIRNGSALTGYYWPSVVNNTEIDNCYLNVVTTQPYYTYRGTVVNRTERLISVRNGMMDGILRYPLTGNLVSSIVAYKLPATWIQYNDVNFKVGLNQLQNSPVYVEADMVQLNNWTFEQTNGIYTTANPLYVTIRNSSRVIVENFNTMWTNRTSANNFTYIIACEYSCDVKFINCRGVGDGWGMTGFNENRKVVFDGCNLSRIDSHQPFIERLDIINCQVAQHGIHFTALADVNIEGGSINLSNDPVYTDKVGFVTLRDECGGMADGWLNISNVALSNRTSTTTQSLVLHRGLASDAPPSGSPVNFRCFSSVNVNGLKSDDRVVNVMPQVNAASGAKYPASVTVTNCQEGIYSINADISANTPANALSSTVAGYTTNVSNLKLTVNNVNIQSNVTLIDTSSPQRWQCDVSLTRLIGGHGFNPGLLCKFGGILNISHSIVEGFDFFSGTALDRYLRVNVTGGAVRHTSRFRTVPLNGVNNLVDITFNGVHCEAASLSQLRVYAQAYLCGCSYSISGSAPTRSLAMTNDGAVSTDTGVTLINTRNSFMTTISVSGMIRRAPFYLPPSGGSSYVQLDNGVFANVTYSGSTITVTTTGGLGNVSIV